MEGKQVQKQVQIVQQHKLDEDQTQIEQEELKKAEQLKQEVIEIVDFTNKIRESLRKANNDLSTVDDELSIINVTVDNAHEEVVSTVESKRKYKKKLIIIGVCCLLVLIVVLSVIFS